MGNPFDDGMSTSGSIAAILLIVAAVLDFFSIGFSWMFYIVAALFVIGGVIGIINSFRAWGATNAGASIVFIILTVIVTLLGVNSIYAIPFISTVLAYIPWAVTHYVMSAAAAIILFIASAVSN